MNIMKVRHTIGWTQKELADKANVSVPSVVRAEKGKAGKTVSKKVNKALRESIKPVEVKPNKSFTLELISDMLNSDMSDKSKITILKKLV